MAKKQLKKAKKKKTVKKVAKKKTLMGAAAADKTARARALVLRALGFTHVTDATTLASLGFDNAPSKAALAQALRALGVNINDGPVIACKTVGQVVIAVEARI